MAVADDEPPGPVQVSTKLVVSVNAAVVWLPDTDLLPDHPPDAVQLVALVDVHVSVDVPFTPTTDGLAVSVTVGATGAAVTLTFAVLLIVPPGPLQVNA